MKLNELRRDLRRSHVEAKPEPPKKRVDGEEELCQWLPDCNEEAVFESNGTKLCAKHELEARLKECPTCNGTGSIDLSNGTTHACPGCDGEGETAP